MLRKTLGPLFPRVLTQIRVLPDGGRGSTSTLILLVPTGAHH